MKAIVTVRIPKNPNHNASNKVTAFCPVNKNEICTDVTGEHHSYIEEGLNMEDVEKKVKKRYQHITRIETITEEGRK